MSFDDPENVRKLLQSDPTWVGIDMATDIDVGVEQQVVSDQYLSSTLRDISRAKSLDSQMISTAFLRMILIEIVRHRAANGWDANGSPVDLAEYFAGSPVPESEAKSPAHKRGESTAPHSGQKIHAQHEETGRWWTGPRGALPKGYIECATQQAANPWKTFAQAIPVQRKYIWWSPDGYRADLTQAADFCEKDTGVWCYAVEPFGRAEAYEGGQGGSVPKLLISATNEALITRAQFDAELLALGEKKMAEGMPAIATLLRDADNGREKCRFDNWPKHLKADAYKQLGVEPVERFRRIAVDSSKPDDPDRWLCKCKEQNRIDDVKCWSCLRDKPAVSTTGEV